MFDYDSISDDELSLRKGEFVQVLDQKDSDCWKGSLNGKEGFFPSNYVKLEKSSISIPKSHPTSVPRAPVNDEPGELKLMIMNMVHT